MKLPTAGRMGNTAVTIDKHRSGPLLEEMSSADEMLRHVPKSRVLQSPQVEVYYVPALGPVRDPEFWMATSDRVLVKFADTGDLTSIQKLDVSGQKRTLDTVLGLGSQYFFHINLSSLPIDGVFHNPEKNPDQTLRELVDYAYERSRSVRDPSAKGAAASFQAMTFDAHVARFILLQTMRGPNDIIPDTTPRLVYIKTGDGCAESCFFCPEGTAPLKIESRENFRENTHTVKKRLVEVVKDEAGRVNDEILARHNEVFINISDIGWIDIYSGKRVVNERNKFGKKPLTDLTALDALAITREAFPWITKMSSFIGSKTALQLSEDPYGNVEHNGKKYSSTYFSALHQAGLNRLYLGLETAHTGGSFLLNKRITYDEKLLAAKLIQDAGIKLKVIVHLGVLGERFCPYDRKVSPANYVEWWEAAEVTAKWLNEVQPYHILESVHVKDPKLPIEHLDRKGRRIPYWKPEQFEQERTYYRGLVKIKRNDHVTEANYEDFLPRKGASIVIAK